MRTLFSATLFFLSFFLLGDSRAPGIAAPAPATFVSVVIAQPMAELCTPSPRSLVVVLVPGAGSVWPLDAAVDRSLRLALGPPERETRKRSWWSLERMVSSRLSTLLPWQGSTRASARPNAPEPVPALPVRHTLGLEGPL